MLTKDGLLQLLADDISFRAWLESKYPDELVGHGCNSMSCPIAAFLGEMTNEAIDVGTFSVGGFMAVYHEDVGLVPLPFWVRSFISFVDVAGRKPITAAQALEAFEY